MASIITATTTSGLTQSADNSGVLQLASGTGNLVTVPSVTGTAMVSGNMPAFSAYATSDQIINNITNTKVTFPTTLYDTTAGMYASSRFTAGVAGYYNVYAFFEWDGTGSGNSRSIWIYKNGSQYRRSQPQTFATGGLTTASVNGIVYLAATDYIEIYCYQTTGTTMTIGNGNGQNYNGFEVCLIRTA